MFEDSGSDQGSKKEIITTVDRIVESEKADETDSEGSVVDISNGHLMTPTPLPHVAKHQLKELFSSVNPVVHLTPGMSPNNMNR